ncbi:MAG: glycoside hydrolase family 2 TIM barrel-domain containing protein [Ginsengibacter sp.]
MKRLFVNFLLLVFVSCTAWVSAQDSTQRWSEKKAWEWYNKQPWYCGFNYIPAYAINYTAMWDKISFDATAIDKELALAETSGMNVLRAVLQYAVYADDPAYFLKTLDTFAAICDKHHIKFVPALFDDCSFGITQDPVVGKQPEPLIGWYAWAWSPSPGHSMVVDSTTHPRLEKYVKAVLDHFKNDQRILFWDLYNEPTNGGLGSATFPLLKKVIMWARSVDPSQPLTIDVFDRNPRLNDIIFAASDIITFHDYENKEVLLKQIGELKRHNRPVICTEWMNRPNGSLIATNLEIFYNEKVGCVLWGLVNGKTQTDLPWGHRPGDPAPKIWQHDLYRGDHTPYDPKEIEMLKNYITTSVDSSLDKK